MTASRFIIDTDTSTQKRVMRRLAALKSTEAVSNGGAYREDPRYSQVHVTTTKTEAELDDWLYRTKGIECLGLVAFPASRGVPAPAAH